MPQDEEFEIKLQFLEEAEDYLTTIEAVLIGLETALHRNQQMDAVLRAAHSIKGGAAMMGFQTLSHLAHRLEDSFKVLKTQKPSVDDQLETLLLSAVDCMRSCIALNRQELVDHTTVLDEQWLEDHVNPVFDQLYQRLGAPQDEDMATLLPENEEKDMVAMIFETEVEGCLERLESVLSDPEKPCLFEEVSIMAQELGGLGEMLQLPAFSSLCESITQHLGTYPERVEEIARLALQTWRRSQAALLVGQVDTLPTQINLHLDQASVPTNEPVTNDINRLNQIITADFDIPNPIEEPAQSVPTVESSKIQTAEPKPVHSSVLSELQSELDSSTEFKENQENTIRVSIKQLDELNDLFGELTIERNTLDLNLQRLRNLVKILSRRTRNLQHFNIRLATQASAVPDVAPLPREPNEVTQPQETSRNQLDNLQLIENIVRIQEVTDDIDLSLEDTDQTVRDLNRTAKQLQTSLTEVRMRPFLDLVGRFPRFLRELSLQYGKKVELKIHGRGTLIDRTILEALSDPLMHLLRNAFDHGIEEPAIRQACGKPEAGLIEIRAAYRGNQTLITVSDDGAGIALDKIFARAQHLGLDPTQLAAASDEELLALIFEPGFSTASQITALSGRGVGLDVVRTNLRQIRGDIKVDTQIGVGTTFTLSVPLTLSIARVLIVESNGMLLAFPTDAIEEMVLLNPEQIFSIAGLEVFSWEGFMTPLIRLGHWLQFQCPHKTVENDAMPVMNAPTVLIVAQGNEWVAIQVDRCWSEQEVAIRQIEGVQPQRGSKVGALAMPPGFNGCTILGDGRVVPLVNAPALLHWIASCKPSYTSQQVEDKLPTTELPQSQKDTILVVDDSINVRRFLSLTLERAGYRVEQAKDGQDGLEKLLSGLQIRAVICDIDMPRLDGYGLLARVKSNSAFQQLPIMMLTSRARHKERQLALNLGATAYFTKPYNEQELVQTLKQLIHN